MHGNLYRQIKNTISITFIYLFNRTKRFCQQHPVFPGGLPSKYWRGSTLLNFGDRTRTGVFNVIWPLTFDLVKNDYNKSTKILQILKDKSLLFLKEQNKFYFGVLQNSFNQNNPSYISIQYSYRYVGIFFFYHRFEMVDRSKKNYNLNW